MNIDILPKCLSAGDSGIYGRCLMNRSYIAYSESRCPYSYSLQKLVFRNLFYRDSVRQSLTSYKLSKNNVKHILIMSHFYIMSINIICLISPCLRAGAVRRKGVK